ncbi:MAG: carbohydrate ABC transporter permease [Firmicutes bacterium]|nr:carbohydrate ABC transporter permease [Bacillota bacterium]
MTSLLPRHMSFGAYTGVLSGSFVRAVVNTIVVSAIATLAGVIVASVGGYAFARFTFPGRKIFLLVALVARMIPAILMILPLYLIIRTLGLLNTYYGLILVYVTITLPLAVWLVTSFFRGIPKEIEEAAIMDGCSAWGVFTRVIVPLSLPGISAIALFVFLGAWNDFLFALTLTTTDKMYTIQVALSLFITEGTVNWNYMMAAAVISTLPVAGLYIVLQRFLIQGLTAGAVKA